MTHDELVVRAVKWLRRPARAQNWSKGGCGVVVPELVSYAPEQPDAIGWSQGCSYVVECKCSSADFRADQAKTHRAIGAGLYRLYLCEPNIIMLDELPSGWGLLYCHAREVTVEAVPAPNMSRNLRYELAMMYSLLRRVEVRGELTRCLAPKWSGDIEWADAKAGA